MKVLIYGEYSGYGRSLSKGFKDLGYHSQVFSFDGDGFKRIDADIQIPQGNRFSKLFSFVKMLPELTTFDNILIMNPTFLLCRRLGPLFLLLAKMRGCRLFLLAAGDDFEFIRCGKSGQLENWPYMDIELPSSKYKTTFSNKIITRLIAHLAYKIIPSMYDYSFPWKQTQFKDKVTETIPLACDGELKAVKKTGEQLTIMHGINREGFKGTAKIKEAMLRIQACYPKRVKLIFPERLPLNEYLKMMETVDIAIDQSKSCSYGMNAIYSMYHGHIVLAPANDKFKADLSLEQCPVISIKNDVDDIYKKLEEVIHRENGDLDKMKYETQTYASSLHNCRVVAQKIEHYLIGC